MVTSGADGFWTGGTPHFLSLGARIARPGVDPGPEMIPMISIAGLVVLGLILGMNALRRWSFWPRLAVILIVLSVCGALAAVGAYVANGVQVGAALTADPLGGAIWFLVAGVQLALPGCIVAAVALWWRQRGRAA